MPTVEPDPSFTPAEKRLLLLLSRLLLETGIAGGEGRNYPPDQALLSNAEAQEILKDLELISGSRAFNENAYFVETVLSGDFNDRVREIFLSGRTKYGRTRTMAAKQWDEFQRRLGFAGSPYYRGTIAPLPFSVFQKMERRLLLKAGIRAPIVDVIMREIAQQEQEIELIRSRQTAVRHGITKGAINNIVNSLKSKLSPVDAPSLSKHQVIGAITLVADSSVMFTTRDWSVAGTLSTMAGAISATLQSE